MVNSLKTMNYKRLTYTFLISLATCVASSCDGKLDKTREHDRKVFFYAAEKLGLEIPEGQHTFIFVTSEGCTGCKPLALTYAKLNRSDTVTFITTSRLQREFEVPDGEQIMIDSAGLIEKLNWKLHGIIEVTTDKGSITGMYNYDINNIKERFIPALEKT